MGEQTKSEEYKRVGRRVQEKETKELRQQELEEKKKEFSWELPREFTAKLLYIWGKKDTKKKEKGDRTRIEKLLGIRKLKGGAVL